MMPALLGTVPFGLGSGFGASDPLDLFLLAHPQPSSGNVADLLRTYPIEERGAVAQRLLDRKVDPKVIGSALSWLEASSRIKVSWPKIKGGLALASGAVSAYHGYKRNDSIAWGVWWFFAGTVFPIFTPVIAVAQGFGKSKK